MNKLVLVIILILIILGLLIFVGKVGQYCYNGDGLSTPHCHPFWVRDHPHLL